MRACVRACVICLFFGCAIAQMTVGSLWKSLCHQDYRLSLVIVMERQSRASVGNIKSRGDRERGIAAKWT